MQKYISAIALLAATVSAHGGVTSYSNAGITYPGWQPYNGASGQKTIEREYDSYNPLMIADLSTDNIRCNNADVLGTGLSATVAAGSQLTAYWLQWTHAPGCVMVYMAACPSSGCNNWKGDGQAWFKINQVGLINGTVGNGNWGPAIVEQTLQWTVTIPASLPSGNYLIRHELLALHQANNPQFYPECAQLTVTGGGSGTPGPLVSFPGAYSGSDPAVNMNIYSAAATTETAYTCPGPSVWPATGGGGSPATTTKAAPTTAVVTTTASVAPTKATTTPSAKPSTTASTTTSRAPTTTPSSGGSCGGLYSQCGGSGWTGPTSCCTGTCKVLNNYYSQCT